MIYLVSTVEKHKRKPNIPAELTTYVKEKDEEIMRCKMRIRNEQQRE
jgi:hypothetical protein